jgi:tetratricopeptide (TPR) repeat protein
MLFEIFVAYRKAKKNLEACQRARTLDPETQAYRQGNYEQALALATDPFMQAEMLIQLCRLSEAEEILRRGDSSAEALRWARLAVEKEKAGPGLSQDSKELCLAEDFSTLAGAVAVHSHDGAEVDRLCQEIAFPAITPRSSLSMSSFLFGKAWAALGNTTESAAHFEAAIQRDPKGLWTREACSTKASRWAI